MAGPHKSGRAKAGAEMVLLDHTHETWVHLRQAGHTWAAIGRLTGGYNPDTVRRWVREYLAEIHDDDLALEIRNEELDRMSALQAALWDLVHPEPDPETGEPGQVNLRALDRYLAVSKRKAALAGADAAVRVRIQDASTKGEIEPTVVAAVNQYMDLVDEALGHGYGSGRPTGEEEDIYAAAHETPEDQRKWEPGLYTAAADDEIVDAEVLPLPDPSEF